MCAGNNKSTDIIPKGPYCYTPIEAPHAGNGWKFKIKPCPYWQRYNQQLHGDLPEEFQGAEQFQGAFCSFLEIGDWSENGTMLLWDQVKECGINDDYDSDELEFV